MDLPQSPFGSELAVLLLLVPLVNSSLRWVTKAPRLPLD